MDTPKRFSKGGIAAAIITAIIGVFCVLRTNTLGADPETVLLLKVSYIGGLGGAAVALFLRSLFGDLGVGRGIALWFGGWLLGFLCGMTLLSGGRAAFDRLVFGLLFGGPLLWVGFRQPQKPPATRSDNEQRPFLAKVCPKCGANNEANAPSCVHCAADLR